MAPARERISTTVIWSPALSNASPLDASDCASAAAAAAAACAVPYTQRFARELVCASGVRGVWARRRVTCVWARCAVAVAALAVALSRMRWCSSSCASIWVNDSRIKAWINMRASCADDNTQQREVQGNSSYACGAAKIQ